MKGISGELVFLLIFAVVIIGQHLVQWFRKNKDQWQDDADMAGDQQAQSPETDELPFLQTPEPAQPEPHAITTYRNKSRGPVVPEQALAHIRRRFSRETLFGSKRRTQDAVVVAMILGPCRADTPHDNRQ